jgi:hypothetical protein
MKRQSAKVQQLKGKIQSLVNLVKLGIKKYIVALLDLEAELAFYLSKQIMLDERIPKTLEDARSLSCVRFHEWNEDCRALVQKFINDTASFEVAGKYANCNLRHPLREELMKLVDMLDGEIRLQTVIPTIAAKLAGLL